MESHTFEKFREIIYKESGIVLPPEKLPLLSNRIQKRLNALGLKSDSEYLEIIELDKSGEELINLIDVVSTNVTHFYREASHFEALRQILSDWQDQNKSNITIWCAAASSGEEPYTIAVESLEAMNPKMQTIRILATDICTKVLNIAMHGIYSESGVEKIPTQIRNKYFEQHSNSNSIQWIVKPSVKSLILFKKLNLVSFPYPLKGPIDIIFCRNVMIYFDLKTRNRIVKEFMRLLSPGGYLFLSHSENLLGIDSDLVKIGGSIFQKSN